LPKGSPTSDLFSRWAGAPSTTTRAGRNLLKQARTQLIETARPLLGAMVEGATGSKVVSLHHDVSTTTGEEVVLFTLAGAPDVREAGQQ
jgi:uncharacterized protein YbcI